MAKEPLSDIEQGFIKRYKNYQTNTTEILKMMPNVLAAIKLTLDDEEYHTLQWEDLQYVPGERVLILIGNIQIAEGDNIKLDDGRVVNVTEENVATLRRLVRVGIPIDLAQTGSVDDVVKYLSANKSADYETMPPEQAEVMDYVEDASTYTSSTGEDYDPNEYYSEDYGAEIDLTDEQYESMKLTPHSKKIH